MRNFGKIKLPSNGLLGYPQEVTIRDLDIEELSTIYASMNDASIERVFKSIIGDQVEISKLVDEDKVYILHKVRQLTFGDEIKTGSRCPFCGFINQHSADYHDFSVVFLTKEQVEETLELSNGDKVSRNFPNEKDKNEIRDLITKFNLTSKGEQFTLSQVLLLGSVNGERLTALERLNYLRQTTPQDFAKIVEFNIVKYGIDTTFTTECNHCSQTYTGGVGLSADLFR